MPRRRQIIQPHIGDHNGLDILCRHRGQTVARKREITRRDDGALGVIHIHILNVRQIADIARRHHIDLVLDRPRMGAIAHPQMPGPVIRRIGHEQYTRPLIRQLACQLREFGIITDQHPDRPAIGLDGAHLIAALDSPPEFLVRRGVDLLLRMHRAGAQENIGHILDVAIIGLGRVRSADDVDIVSHRQAAHVFNEAGRMFRQRLDRFLRRQLALFQRQQSHGEHLRKHAEIRPVVRTDIDEILDVALEGLKAVFRPRLKLHCGHTHRARFRPDRCFLILDPGRIVPSHQQGIAEGIPVLVIIPFHQPHRLEALPRPEGIDRVPGLLGLHRLQIFSGVPYSLTLRRSDGKRAP